MNSIRYMEKMYSMTKGHKMELEPTVRQLGNRALETISATSLKSDKTSSESSSQALSLLAIYSMMIQPKKHSSADGPRTR